MKDVGTKTCSICGEVYRPRVHNQKTCGKFECLCERVRVLKIKDKTGLYPKRECPYCHVTFRPFQYNQVTCGSVKCKNDHSMYLQLNRQAFRAEVKAHNLAAKRELNRAYRARVKAREAVAA